VDPEPAPDAAAVEQTLGVAEARQGEVEVAVHRADLEVGDLAGGDGRQRSAQGEVRDRDAGARTGHTRGGLRQRGLG
jgi:hypothetical protein